MRTLMFVGLTACVGTACALAQSPADGQNGPISSNVAGWSSPVADNQVFTHVIFDQLEGRTSGPDNKLRWDGQGWIGTDKHKLWFKSEGSLSKGKVSDGDHELLYDRPIPHLRYFDVQAGVREDLDSGPHRTWGAVGIEGLAPYFFQFEPTFYFSSGGRLAGRVTGSYDLLLTQRLILQPQLEINLYSKNDLARGTGSGLSDLDTGLRLRYEVSRKFAPYVGFVYSGRLGLTATYARQAGESIHNPTFVFGARLWF
ncbi:MAG: copper resistance protein B [Terriglobales bacterium]